ncbi:MAG: glycoside hydrolase family 5 protein [Clostridia bacterium]|nr:glycoside hydrolase family 5 protein [Clostridia bacterium]
MTRTAKKICALLFAVLLILPVTASALEADDDGAGAYAPITETDFLRVEGEKLFKADGSETVLRGTNFGGWGIMEDWFCPFENPAGEELVYDTLVERFGAEATRELFKTYRSNWITETDYKNVADLGFNCIRLPIWYRNFQSDDNGTWYRNADGSIDFSELDGVVEMCRKYGLYLIIDLHGLAGYQNDYDHCGRSKSMSLFDETPEGERYRAVAVDFWTELAKHYAGDPTIAMYDLMNEPCGTNITRDASMKDVFWQLSDDIYDAVRAVDPDHIITMEAIWDPSAIASPDVYGWENIVYQEHLYDISNPAILSKVNEIRDADYGAPFYIGEFYPRGLTTFGYMLSLFNKQGLSWTTWTYKGAGSSADDSPWFLYGSSTIEKIDPELDSYEELLVKWGECLRTDSGSFRQTSFAEYAAGFTDGSFDKTSLDTFGLIETKGTPAQRAALFRAKLQAIVTTIKDWLRKLKTGDLL